MAYAHHGFRRTQELFERAKQVIPGGIYGHQTPRMLVEGAYPYFFAHGAGAHVWDVDGNEYIDYVCSYGPIVLGHNHPVVEAAAEEQRRKGDCLNGPTPLWVDLAEHLVAITPWAAWSSFAKNGSDSPNARGHRHSRRSIESSRGKSAHQGSRHESLPVVAIPGDGNHRRKGRATPRLA
jgi:glutamate-1-semialdehyde aminotransferase